MSELVPISRHPWLISTDHGLWQLFCWITKRLCVWHQLFELQQPCFLFRVGLSSAKVTQDIVLSGQHIKDEHCILQCKRSSAGESMLLLLPGSVSCREVKIANAVLSTARTARCRARVVLSVHGARRLLWYFTARSFTFCAPALPAVRQSILARLRGILLLSSGEPLRSERCWIWNHF